jgi:hypothetical protein
MAAGRGPDREGRTEDEDVRRIAFCGSSRTSETQWREFLGELAALPFGFRIFAFADRDSAWDTVPPGNVSVRFEAYLPSEKELIDRLADGSFHAGYLGVWRDGDRHLFARTSLSSKIVTYAAAGLPILVDAPADSVVWRLVERYRAGVPCGGAGGADKRNLETLFADPEAWAGMSRGASRLCAEQFNLERNVEAFKVLLCDRAAG